MQTAGFLQRFFPRIPASTPAPTPVTPVIPKLFRKWYPTPWKNMSFLDAALNDGEDGTDSMDILNNLITQGGNYLTSRNNPYGTYIPRPAVGQAVPLGSSLGLTSTQLLLGAVVVGGLFLAMKGRR